MEGLFSGTVTGAARKIGHAVGISITATLLFFLNVYIIYKARKRPPPDKYGPMILVLFATIFIIADPLRHVLLDTGLWPSWTPNGLVTNAWAGGKKEK